jgi:uncharacterized repeat protein (TIGR01451 family)
MRTDLRFTHLTLVPDQPTRVAIEVVNTADVIDGVTAIIDGLDQDWIHFDEPLVRLFPGASGEVSFTIKVPPECPAGDYLVVVRIVSTISADRQSVQDFWATVDPVEAGTLDVVPQIVTGRTKAQLRTTVSNTGNTPTTFRLDVVDAAGEIDCQVDPREVRIDPAMRQDAIVRMRGPRPWFGGVVSRSILLKAATDEVELTAVATFNQKPRISRGLITFLTLAAIVALWATMFVFVIGFIRNQEVPGKATATAIDGGEQEIPIGKIAASAGGTVTSSTLGEGVPGVAVQAFRVKAQSNPDLAQGFRMQADGELELELAAEAATGDDGVFLLGSLLPGSYQLKFKGAGFSEQWYPGVTSQSEAEVISFAPLGEELGLDIELVGDAGAFSGVIDQSGSGGAPGNFKVTATLIPPNPDPDNPPEPIEGTVNPDGTYELGDLPAPNDYLVQIEDLDGNFATEQFVISVAAGEVKQLNPIVPSASAGKLGGLVVDGAGLPLGGVAVTLRNGDFVLEAVTPTTGDTGSFLFIGLPTPATYIVTFSLEGFTGQTIALELGPGAVDESLRASLIGGLGTINGNVRDQLGNPLGATAVLVEGNGFSAATAALTDAGSTGGVGSFFVSGIPVPGSYTVTFELDGYESVSIPALFGANGGSLSPNVTLTPIAGRVEGVVTSSAGGAVADVAVLLSNGIAGDDRSTVTASAPAGTFSFTGVAPGAYTVRFSAPGFVPYVRLVTVDLGSTVNADVTLRAIEVPPPFVPSPSFTVASTVSSRVVAAPGTLTYTITVANTGNVGLSGVTVSNSLAGAATLVSGDDNSNSIIETDEVWVYSATYTVTQAMIDAGADLVNTTRVATSEVTTPVVATATTTITQNPAVTVSSTVRPPGGYYAGVGGQTLTFEIIVDNDGNVGLSGVTVSNDLAGAATLVSGDANSNSIIETDEVWVYEATYSVTGSDFEAAAVVNTVSVVTAQVPGPTTASATAPNLGSVPSGSVP